MSLFTYIKFVGSLDEIKDAVTKLTSLGFILYEQRKSKLTRPEQYVSRTGRVGYPSRVGTIYEVIPAQYEVMYWVDNNSLTTITTECNGTGRINLSVADGSDKL